MKLYQTKHFSVFAKKIQQTMGEAEIFFCYFPNPWILKVSGMGQYAKKVIKKSKSQHFSVHDN
jgi:hypothetical protein